MLTLIDPLIERYCFLLSDSETNNCEMAYLKLRFAAMCDLQKCVDVTQVSSNLCRCVIQFYLIQETIRNFVTLLVIYAITAYNNLLIQVTLNKNNLLNNI